MNKYILFFGILAMSAGTRSHASSDSGLNSNELKIKVYKVALSTDPLCTNPVTVFTAPTGGATFQDFLNSPSLGSGGIDNGTYPCVIIEMSDNIKFAPSATSTSGHCVQNTESILQVCGGGSGSSMLVDGTSVTCNLSDNHVAMYLSTASNGNGQSDNAFLAPAYIGDSTQGLKLSKALVVNGSSIAKFVVDASGQVRDSGGICDLEPPTFTFEQ